MPTAYVVHAAEDCPFIQPFLRVLPSNGYGHWLPSHHAMRIESELASEVDRCSLILVVLSSALARSKWAAAEIEIALKSRLPLIAIQIGKLDQHDASQLPAAVWSAPRVDLALEGEMEAARLLAALLPPVDESAGASTPKHAEQIEWDEEIFSASLVEATKRHDHARAESLVRAIVAHLMIRPYPYPSDRAAGDLQDLRQEREFELMRRYGETVIASGTRKDKVRRLFAQALIETKEYERALELLRSIIDDTESSKREVFEAHGLIGRTYKQRYVEAPDAEDAAALIRRAIEAYETVYSRDSDQLWHGVNAASCILRAQRDGIAAGSPGRAQEIAQQVLEKTNQLAKIGSLEVWDCASRVEALLTLERYDDAEHALDVYINHRDMRAFEVSSTFRQFDQLLKLGRHSRGAAILERLRAAVERHRAGKLATSERKPSGVEVESVIGVSETKPLIIRVGDPLWKPKDIPEFMVQTRLGKIITAEGSEVSIRELLKDPLVISIEESRPAGGMDCERSVPFVKVAPEYVGPAGNKYNETGDRALIAIIDNGIDVLHEAFLDDAGNSRILGIWDQNDASGPPPKPFTYGTFHDEAAIAGYREAGNVPPGLGRNDKGHGTHVASIAAGRKAGAFAGGVAPDAKLLIVVSAGEGPIGYSRTHIDALSFIDAFAATRNMPVVVNVSQGMNAGAHDGKSPLEVAFDAFSESGRKEGRVVVKSAGNERAKGGHAKVTMPPNAFEELIWQRVDLPNLPAAMTERIELWWSAADEITFQLRDPAGERSPVVGAASPEAQGTFAKGGPFKLTFTPRHIDNGDSLLLIEIGSDTAKAALGKWTLEMTSTVAPEGGEIHAWIERRNRRNPTSFVNHQSEEMTLSIPATASSVIAVGAVEASNPIKVGAFSSYGPTRDHQKKPLVCAPGVGVRAAYGGTANGAYAESGTSMAAPHVAGAIALLLSRTAKSGRIPGANQIASALRQKTQNYNGRWDRGQGYGVIDVSALLGAF